jgi:hypothetical protein
MLWQNGSVCYVPILVFQRLSAPTFLPGGDPFLRYRNRFLVFPIEATVPDVIAVNEEKPPDLRPNQVPPARGNTGDPGELDGVIREPSAVPPHGHEKQEICAMLFGRQFQRIGQIVADV